MSTVVPLGRLPRRVGIAVAEFNEPITRPMEMAARATCDQAGIDDVVVMHVPGAIELPVAVKALIDVGRCEAVVAIGAVIKGETDHYEHVASVATHGIAEVALATGVPVGNAVLTVHDYEHALERSRPGPGNKGAEAAHAAIVTAQRVHALRDHDRP